MQALFPLIFLALMWFLLVRPQREQARRRQRLVASLEVGDEVVTAGGIVGRIVALDDDEAHVEVAPGVTIRFLRVAINTRVGADDASTDALGEPEAADDRSGE